MLIESAADTLAQNDVNSNKQSYANSQGKCNCVENCDCNLAGEVDFEDNTSIIGGGYIHVAYNLDMIPKGNCQTSKSFKVTFDLNTGASHDIILVNDTTSNVGAFDMAYPPGQYNNLELSVGTTCGGYNTVTVTKS